MTTSDETPAFFSDMEIPDGFLGGPMEHIELGSSDDAEGSATQSVYQRCVPNDRKHWRINDEDIDVRFSIGVRQGLGVFRRSHPCQVVDISMGGICIEAERSVGIDETINLHITSKQDQGLDKHFLAAKVVRRRMSDRKTYRYGIEFCNTLSDGLRTAICQKTIQEKIDCDATVGALA